MQSHTTEEIERTESADREGEYRIFGPPGTGKTTYISRQVEHAVQRFGADQIMVTSFSRAAAAELAGRDLGLPDGAVGTLHSHCYRALGSPLIAELHVKAWNEEYPSHRITPGNKSRLDDSGMDDRETGEHKGDAMLMRANERRARLVAERYWPRDLQEFWHAWQDYKRSLNLMDFTDMIENALNDVHLAPGAPAVIFADEAQDLTPMQLKLIRRWGEHATYFILAGDDDQLIYPHLGCTPEGLLDPPLGPERSIVLGQSYRVPSAVQEFAERWIQNVMRRQPKHYLPRVAAGTIERSPIQASVNGLQPLARILADARDAHESLMILTTCNYQLHPILNRLREIGVPFHNPYRRSNPQWNPLVRRKGGAIDRMRALLAAHPACGGRFWTQEELLKVVDWMAAGAPKDWPKEKEWVSPLIYGAKAWLKKNAVAGQRATAEMLRQVFTPEALGGLVDAFEGPPGMLTKWWSERLAGDHQPTLRFPLRVAEQRGGLEALDEEPSVIVGTIHSVKGGEADRVLLFPDLSPAGWEDFTSGGRDHGVRVFYVGITRARDRLILARPVGQLGVAWSPNAYRRQ